MPKPSPPLSGKASRPSLPSLEDFRKVQDDFDKVMGDFDKVMGDFEKSFPDPSGPAGKSLQPSLQLLARLNQGFFQQARSQIQALSQGLAGLDHHLGQPYVLRYVLMELEEETSRLGMNADPVVRGLLAPDFVEGVASLTRSAHGNRNGNSGGSSSTLPTSCPILWHARPTKHWQGKIYGWLSTWINPKSPLSIMAPVSRLSFLFQVLPLRLNLLEGKAGLSEAFRDHVLSILNDASRQARQPTLQALHAFLQLTTHPYGFSWTHPAHQALRERLENFYFQATTLKGDCLPAPPPRRL